ncbi:hypothetical protein [Streptomyces albogriseolus]|uniref:hypothetical protein n=1 Tax=Streptomyces albogriseolus TaxID=1887 RepID=UPI0022572CEF|nr:hypothetical protein [Streptomyces viridodiastaticus]MCX4625086.1 hypothetical protein [Streptomyces viridodiastaticus]
MTARRRHLRAVPTPPEQPVAPVQLLNWRHYSHFGPPAPCVLCGTTTPLRSHAKEPVHKVCAELWNAAHPGEMRFVSDPPKGGGTTDHA